MDRLTGDGDLGTTMERAAKAVQTSLDSYPLDNVPATLKAIGYSNLYLVGVVLQEALLLGAVGFVPGFPYGVPDTVVLK